MDSLLGEQGNLRTEMKHRLAHSPNAFDSHGFRYFFYSSDRDVRYGGGVAKFWLLPIVALAGNKGLNQSELRKALHILRRRRKEALDAWTRHFG